RASTSTPGAARTPRSTGTGAGRRTCGTTRATRPTCCTGTGRRPTPARGRARGRRSTADRATLRPAVRDAAAGRTCPSGTCLSGCDQAVVAVVAAVEDVAAARGVVDEEHPRQPGGVQALGRLGHAQPGSGVGADRQRHGDRVLPVGFGLHL